MQRIINFRPFLIIAIFALSAVTCGAVFAIANVVVGIILASSLLIIVTVFSIAFRKNSVKLFTFILSAIVVSWCFISSLTYFTERNSAPNFDGDVVISGKVSEVISHDSTNSLLLENLAVDGITISGKLSVRLNDEDKDVTRIKCGDIVSFNGRPLINKLEFDNLSFYEIKYYAYTSLNNLTVKLGTLDFKEQLLDNLRSTYKKCLGEYGDLAYGIVTGNKNGLTNEFRSAYSVSGLGHILAVSGLHVGFLMTLITALLNLLKVHKKVQPFLSISILLLYNYLVGFSFSVIRASIMFTLAYLARLRNKPNDQLNNLCFAIVVIVCIFPYALFDVGFLMSVGCVLSITLFSKGFTEFLLRLSKNRFKKLLSALAISVCAQIGIFPVTTFYFSSMSTYSVLANVIAFPVLNLIYVFVLVFGLLSLLISHLNIVLALAKYLFIIIDCINAFIQSLPLSEIRIYASASIFVLYALYLVSSRFVMVTNKFLAVLLCILLSVGIVMADNLRFVGDMHIVYANANCDVTTLVKTDDKYVIVGDLTKYCKIESCIKNSRAHLVESIYLTHLSAQNEDYVINLAKKYKVSFVYVRDDAEIMSVQSLLQSDINVKHVSSQSIIHEIAQDGEFVGYKYKDVLFTSYYSNLEILSKEYLSTYEVVRAYSYSDVTSVKLALNFSYDTKNHAACANANTVLLDCNTLNKKLF